MSTINTKMTAIADQIRALVGKTTVLGLDTMATNLQSANTAVSNIKTQISNKGVSVPSSADILDIASYISQIETGGAGGHVSGTITLSSITNTINISHSLGATPRGFVLFCPDVLVTGATWSDECVAFMYYLPDLDEDYITFHIKDGDTSYSERSMHIRQNDVTLSSTNLSVTIPVYSGLVTGDFYEAEYIYAILG